jgi:HEAT repeat protein
MEWPTAASLAAAAVPALIGALKDRFATVRRDAVKTLGKIADPRAAEALCAALADKDIRWPAAESLIRIGPPAVPWVVAALKHDSPSVREAAAHVLGDVGDAQGEAALLHALKDRAKEVRHAAAEALGRLRGDGSVDPLAAALRDGDESVRTAALAALVDIGARSVPALIGVLKDDDTRLRELALSGLVRLGEPAVLPLVAVLKEGGPDVRLCAAEALGLLRHPGGQAPLVVALKDSRWILREAAAKALGRIEGTGAIDPLAEALRDPEWVVRKAAGDALKALAWQPADDGQRALRAVALLEWDRAAALGAPAVEALTAAVADADGHVREAAAEALGRCGDPAAVALLVGALGDKDPRVQRAAAIGLGRLGGDAQSALGPLASLAQVGDDKLAKAATEAAERIRRSVAPA